MQRRFDAYLPEESQQNSSLLEAINLLFPTDGHGRGWVQSNSRNGSSCGPKVKQSETAEEVDHIKMVEDALWKQLAARRQRVGKVVFRF